MEYAVIFLLVFLETSVYVDFPYNAVAISFIGYITSKKEFGAIPYAVTTGIIVGLSGYHVERPVVFLIILVVVLRYVYKVLMIDRATLILITFIELAMYFIYIYFFEFKDIKPVFFLKEFLFIFLMNYVLHKADKNEKI